MFYLKVNYKKESIGYLRDDRVVQLSMVCKE